MIAMTSPAFFLPLAEAGFTWSGVAERLVAIALSAGLTGLVTVYVLRAQIAALSGQVADLGRTAERNSREIARSREDRAMCELTAARTFARREDFGEVLVQSTAGHREVMVKLDQVAETLRAAVGKVHQRIDGVQERVTRVEEQVRSPEKSHA